MVNTFIHLRTHTNYSLSEGMLTSDYIANFCKDKKQPACAISDTSNLFGVFEFSIKLLSYGVQPIIGMQINISDGNYNDNSNEIVLICKNEVGYKNLVKLSNIINNQVKIGFKKSIKLNILKDFKAGLILLGGGAEDGYIGFPASKNDYEIAEKRTNLLKEIFQNDFYIEIQRHDLEREKIAEPILLDIAYKVDVPIVATNDSYFKTKEEFEAHEVLMMIDKGLTISSKKTRFLSKENYLKNTNEMTNLFKDIPEAIENTIFIAKRCSYCLREKTPVLPSFVSSNKNLSEEQHLENLSTEGLKKRLNFSEHNQQEESFEHYFLRLKNELNVIKKMGFAGYFLIVSDFVKWSKKNNIPVGPGRGSGAGSIVAWALDITDLDPIKWGLLFERFLNPDRISMPDFDIDFCQERRDEVINYIKNKYGHDHVAQIITFGSLQARAAIRDVGRVLEMPYGQVDKIAKMIPAIPANPVKLSEALSNVEDLKKEKNEDEGVSKVIDIAQEIEGLNRHISTHAAGIVISEKPLADSVPLYSEFDQEIPATQFNMKYVEKAGLVKFDILGLKTLTIISKTESLIQKTDSKFKISKISLADKKIYEMLSKGKTVGVFQLESNGMQNVLTGLKPERFEDIMAVLSLFRPGPMENIPKYINRKQGLEKVEYMHSKLASILKETYGIFIYQEQVMQAAQILAGYSLSSADILRRAMGKKDRKEMEQQKQEFINGAAKEGLSSEISQDIFEQISAFAGYGFNKSHAAAYALISYQCAWLKSYYPHEFFSSLMTYDDDNTDKLFIYLNDLKRLSINLLPPNINKSYNYFNVEIIDNDVKAIRCSLSSLKNVGSEAVRQLIEIRNKKGNFSNIDSFINKLPLNIIGKRGLESLIKAGAFDELETNRNKLFSSISIMLLHSQKIIEDAINSQESLFKSISNIDLSASFKNEIDWSVFLKQTNEFSSLGYHLNFHPLKNYIRTFEKLNIKTSFDLTEILKSKNDKIVKICGLINKITKRTSENGKNWAIVEVNDLEGLIEVIYSANNLFKLEEIYEKGHLYCLDVNIKFDKNNNPRILEIKTHDLNELVSKNNFNVELEINDLRCLKNIKESVVNLKSGNSNIMLNVKKDRKVILLNIKEKVYLDSIFLKNVVSINGINSIKFN